MVGRVSYFRPIIIKEVVERQNGNSSEWTRSTGIHVMTNSLFNNGFANERALFFCVWNMKNPQGGMALAGRGLFHEHNAG